MTCQAAKEKDGKHISLGAFYQFYQIKKRGNVLENQNIIFQDWDVQKYEHKYLSRKKQANKKHIVWHLTRNQLKFVPDTDPRLLKNRQETLHQRTSKDGK